MNNDFEILDQRKKGVPSYETRFPNDALIAVNKTMFTIFSKAVDKIGITDKCKILIARRGGNFYIAKLDEISGGEQQRVAIGAALAAGQKLLLLDEPTSALDAEIASKTMSLLRRLSKDEKITVILTEHRVERALEFLDSIVIVHKDGSVVKKPASVAFQELRIQPAIIALGKKMGWDPLETKLSKAQARWNVSARELPITVKPRRQFASTSDRKLIASSKDICVTFGNIRALSKLNLSLESSQITAIMGKNGSGKSTALWALQGSKPSQAASVTGQMLIVGFDPAGMDAEDRLDRKSVV